jgi:hypothetical protein
MPTTTLDQLVTSYLAHNGYLATAQELCRATGLSLREPAQLIAARRGTLLLKRQADHFCSTFSVAVLLFTSHALTLPGIAISDKILKGEIDAACDLIEQNFAGLLTDSPRLRFEIQRRKFVELAAATQTDDDQALDSLLAYGRDLQTLADSIGDATLQTKLEVRLHIPWCFRLVLFFSAPGSLPFCGFNLRYLYSRGALSPPLPPQHPPLQTWNSRRSFLCLHTQTPGTGRWSIC